MGLMLTDSEVDIQELLASGQPPGKLYTLIKRAANEQWFVAHSPIQLHERVRWGPVKDGDFVYVPIIPYRTHHDANKAIKFAITMGLRAGLDIDLIPGRDIKRLHMVTGKVTEDLAESEGVQAFRFHLGFAVQTS